MWPEELCAPHIELRAPSKCRLDQSLRGWDRKRNGVRLGYSNTAGEHTKIRGIRSGLCSDNITIKKRTDMNRGIYRTTDHLFRTDLRCTCNGYISQGRRHASYLSRRTGSSKLKRATLSRAIALLPVSEAMAVWQRQNESSQQRTR